MLMTAVMMTVASSAWATPSTQQGTGGLGSAWSCPHAASDADAADDRGPSKLNTAPPSVSIDDERAELDVMHGLNVPAPLADTHPPLAPALDPADNWPGLPLRPPKH